MQRTANTVLLCSIIFCCTISCLAENQGQIDIEDSEDTDADYCAKDERIATICLKCGSLQFYALPLLDTCCSERSAFLFCEACVNDQDSCETLMKEIEDVDTFSKETVHEADYYDDESGDSGIIDDELEMNGELLPMPYPITTAVEKRFGKLFVNRSPKRFGRIFFGKRSDRNMGEDTMEMGKRFGRLYMGSGSYFGKRNDIDKRYGRLFTASNTYFGKRAPSIMDSEIEESSNGHEEPDDFDVSKRYGRVYMGSRNKLFGKRYGRVFVGKRSNDDIDKRYGQLYLGRNKYFTRYPTYVNMNKRYGRLFTGRRKYYFGK